MKKNIIIILALFCFNVIYTHEASQEIILPSNSDEKFVDVIEYFNNSQDSAETKSIPHILTLEVGVKSNHFLIKTIKQQSSQRDYNIPVSQTEKNDLAYITNTLARSSLPGLAVSKSKLKKAGDRIDHLHPLRFLMTIFTDEELKANINAIRSQGGWVWDKFYDGLEGSLKAESQKKNMRDEFIVDFANTIGIKVTLIQNSIQEGRWKEFVNTLIDSIPRSGNVTRYDM